MGKINKIVATIGALVWFVIPSASFTYFDGLPLAAPQLFWLALIVMAIWFTPLVEERRYLNAVLLGIAVWLVIGAKIAPTGWNVCFKREVGTRMLATPCEPTMQFPRGDRSYVVNHINWPKGRIPLYFMNNTAAFNYFLPEDPDRQRLPYSLRAETYLHPADEQTVTVATNIGGVRITHNGQRIEAQGEQTTFSLAPGAVNQVVIEYTAANAPDHYLRLVTESQPMATPESVGAIELVGYSLILVLLIGSVTIWAAAAIFKAVATWTYRQRLLAVLLVAGLALTSVAQTPLWMSVVMVATISFGLSRGNSPSDTLHKAVVAWLLLLHLAIFVSHRVAVGEVILYPGGGDELGHEWYARSTFLATSWIEYLIAAEPYVFYYQPLHRYVLGLVHVVVGEGMWGVYTVQAALLALMFFVTARFVGRVAGMMAVAVFAVISVFTLNTIGLSLWELALSPYQQAIALPLVIIGLFVVLEGVLGAGLALWGWLAAGLGLGLALFMRTDYLPVLLLMAVAIVYALLRRRVSFRSAAALALGLAPFPVLVALRNFAVAGEWVVLPTSSAVNLLPELRPYASFGGAALAAIIRGYAGNWGELARILGINGFVAYFDTWPRVVLILATIIAVYFWSPRQTGRLRLVTLFLIGAVTVWVGVSLFFGIHNQIAMRGHIDFLLVVLLALAIATGLRLNRN